VFTKLNEISVNAYGINRMFGVTTSTPSKQLIADKLAKTDLALPQGDGSGQLNYTQHQDEVDTNIQIGPSSVEERRINVIYNRHHQIKPQSGYYDVAKMMEDCAELDWASAAQYAELLAIQVKTAERI
jgi:hypothetical protein